MRERNSNIPLKVPTKPKLLILFLNFLYKTKSKDLAVNGNAMNFQVAMRPALHIGAVIPSYFFVNIHQKVYLQSVAY